MFSHAVYLKNSRLCLHDVDSSLSLCNMRLCHSRVMNGGLSAFYKHTSLVSSVTSADLGVTDAPVLFD